MYSSGFSIIRCTSRGSRVAFRKRRHHGNADRNVRHEVPVHHIDMEQRRAAAFDGADSFSQGCEVCGENGRGDFNRIGHNFSARILPESALPAVHTRAVMVDIRLPAMTCAGQKPARDRILYCATTSSMGDVAGYLRAWSGVCSMTVPFGHCGEEVYVVFASFSPPEESSRSASGSGMPTSHGMT